MESLIRNLKMAMLQHKLSFEANFKIKMDFSEESILNLEKSLNKMYPVGFMARDTTMITTGFYIGETAIKHVKGSKWVEPITNYVELTVIAPVNGDTSTIIQPVEMVKEYLEHRIMSPYQIYRTFKEISEGKREVDGSMIKGDLPVGVGYTVYNAKE